MIDYSTSQTPLCVSPRTPELTNAEMNILRLAAVSVPFSLLKKCRRLPEGERKRAVLACVESMRVGWSTGDHITTPTDSDSPPSASADSWSTADESSLSWINLIDRGGLFRINEATFQFFVVLEKQMAGPLQHNIQTAQSEKEPFRELFTVDEEIRHHLAAVVSGSGLEELASLSLLSEVVQMWITRRGFSTTASWLERYKDEKKRQLNKSKGLRKQLKTSHNLAS